MTTSSETSPAATTPISRPSTPDTLSASLPALPPAAISAPCVSDSAACSVVATPPTAHAVPAASSPPSSREVASSSPPPSSASSGRAVYGAYIPAVAGSYAASHGYIGIQNLASSCYFNTAIQVGYSLDHDLFFAFKPSTDGDCFFSMFAVHTFDRSHPKRRPKLSSLVQRSTEPLENLYVAHRITIAPIRSLQPLTFLFILDEVMQHLKPFFIKMMTITDSRAEPTEDLIKAALYELTPTDGDAMKFGEHNFR